MYLFLEDAILESWLAFHQGPVSWAPLEVVTIIYRLFALLEATI